MVWGSNSGRGKRFFLLQNRPDLLWGPPRYWDSFPRMERSRLEVDYSPPRSTDIKNKWSYTPTPPICVRGVDGNLHCAFHCTSIWRYKEVLLLLAAAWTWPIFPSSLSLSHQSDQNTRITAPFRRTKGRVNGVATDRMCERKLHYCSFVCLFVCYIAFFPHQLPPPVHNTNSTTQCIGVVCLWTEVWRAV